MAKSGCVTFTIVSDTDFELLEPVTFELDEVRDFEVVCDGSD